MCIRDSTCSAVRMYSGRACDRLIGSTSRASSDEAGPLPSAGGLAARSRITVVRFAASPDAANRTTVIRDLAASPPADGSGPASSLLARLVDPIRRSHALPEYIRTAEQVAVLRDRSVQSY